MMPQLRKRNHFFPGPAHVDFVKNIHRKTGNGCVPHLLILPTLIWKPWQEKLYLWQKFLHWMIISLPQGFQKGSHPVKYKPFLHSFSGLRQEGNKMFTEIQLASVSIHGMQASIQVFPFWEVLLNYYCRGTRKCLQLSNKGGGAF